MPAIDRLAGLPGKRLAKQVGLLTGREEAGAARALHHVRQGERKPRNPESNNLASSAGQSRKTRVRDAEERGQGSSLGRTSSKNAPVVCASNAGECAKNNLAAQLRRRWSGLLRCTAWKRGARQGCKLGPDQAKKRDDKRLE
jgi:hypothetical protein